MSYFLFYPPLALPADILSCNSPVTWRAMEAEDIERNRVCLGIKRASWEDLGEYTGSSMCLLFLMMMMTRCFANSAVCLAHFSFHRSCSTMRQRLSSEPNFFVLSDTLPGMRWRARPFFFVSFFLVLPSVNFLPQLLVEASAYPQIIKHLRGYSPSS